MRARSATSRPLERLRAARSARRARVRIVAEPQTGATSDGSVTSRQTAKVTLPITELERLWSPEYLERLARTYWRYLTRISLGLLRVLYTEESREVVFLTRPFVLLRFHKPEYEIEPDSGTVTWRIERGVLVAPAGRGKGYLRISVRRPPADDPDWRDDEEITATVSSEVANFYPMIAGWGWFSRIGHAVYRITQYRLHVIVTHGFLRSLARLDLVPSVVGALRPPDAAATEGEGSESSG
jgi:hypothetical protein